MRVQLPTPLVDYTGGVREVRAAGGSVAALLVDLDRQFPGIRFRMIDEQDRFRPHIRLFVNRQLARALDLPLKPDDEILIVAALSGG